MKLLRYVLILLKKVQIPDFYAVNMVCVLMMFLGQKGYDKFSALHCVLNNCNCYMIV